MRRWGGVKPREPQRKNRWKKEQLRSVGLGGRWGTRPLMLRPLKILIFCAEPVSIALAKKSTIKYMRFNLIFFYTHCCFESKKIKLKPDVAIEAYSSYNLHFTDNKCYFYVFDGKNQWCCKFNKFLCMYIYTLRKQNCLCFKII